MTVHLLKPALRVTDLSSFQKRQKQWHTQYCGQTVYPVWTSRKPARIDEMLNGGSVFWIVRKAIQCRQAIIGFEELQEEDEKPSYLIFCEPQLIRTVSVERKPFQGWRYLEATSAPPDIGKIYESDSEPPDDMAQALKEAGLL